MLSKLLANMCPHATLVLILTPTIWIALIYLLTVHR